MIPDQTLAIPSKRDDGLSLCILGLLHIQDSKDGGDRNIDLRGNSVSTVLDLLGSTHRVIC